MSESHRAVYVRAFVIRTTVKENRSHLTDDVTTGGTPAKVHKTTNTAHGAVKFRQDVKMRMLRTIALQQAEFCYRQDE